MPTGKFELKTEINTRRLMAFAADVPQHTRDLLDKYGLPVPPRGHKYPLAELDAHLAKVPLRERLLVKAELSQRGWL
jgi:hypothetical protein